MQAHLTERCCLCEVSQLPRTSGPSRSQRGTLCGGKTLPGTNPEFGYPILKHGSPSLSQRQAATSSELLCRPSPQNGQGPPWGRGEALPLLRHSAKRQQKNDSRLPIVYSHSSLSSTLGTHTLAWKSHSRKKNQFRINDIWLMINDKEQSKTAVSLLLMIRTHF